jgi:hypothetical protein
VGTGGIQQRGNLSTPKPKPTGAPKPRLQVNTPTEGVIPPKRPRASREPETYKVALTNIKIAIFKDNYPEDKLIEDEQDLILE